MSIDRLRALKETNDNTGIEMLMEVGRFTALADRKNNGLAPIAVSSFNLFQTPVNIADQMLELIDFKGNSPIVLEPSAGLGRLYKAMLTEYPQANYTLVENSSQCMEQLYKISGNAKLKQDDFLELNDLGLFDIILMNPPFKNAIDIKHILHAKSMLAPGGQLIGLCANGPRQKKQLEHLCSYWEPLPRDSFKAEGTNVNVILFKME